MISLQQRNSECSLCAIATLNDLSQKDYEALSRLVRDQGAIFKRGEGRLHKAIDIGINTAKALGLYVPPDYPRKDLTGEPVPDFSGRGIVRVRYIRKRCRKLSHHVITFQDGVLYDSAGVAYPNWDAYAAQCKSWGIRNLTILKIFR